MGYQLSKKGKTYRDRCIYRNPPLNKGDNVFSPASFPPTEKEATDNTVVPELPKEDLEEVRHYYLMHVGVIFDRMDDSQIHSLLV
jgi:hypothetical protein